MYMSKENLPDLFNYVGYFNLFISFFSLLHPSFKEAPLCDICQVCVSSSSPNPIQIHMYIC